MSVTYKLNTFILHHTERALTITLENEILDFVHFNRYLIMQ